MARRRTPLYLVYEGRDLDGPLYRIVKRCPPTLEDFLSYEELGKPYIRRRYFRGIGVSMFRSARRAEAVARRYGHGNAVATVDLACDGVVWSPTRDPDHVTVWAPPELLLTRVVQCVEHE